MWRDVLLLLPSLPVLVQNKCYCTWTEQHLPWLMPVLRLTLTLCSARAVTASLSMSACHDGHQTALSCVTPACITG